MRKSRLTDEHIIAILRQGDAGAPIAELSRSRVRRGGGERGEATPKGGRAEPSPQRLVADQAVNIQVLNDLLEKR